MSLNAGDIATPGYYQITVLNLGSHHTLQPQPNPPLSWSLNPTGPPVLGITKSHTGNFNQGQTEAQYTILVSNAGAGSYRRSSDGDRDRAVRRNAGFDDWIGMDLYS